MKGEFHISIDKSKLDIPYIHTYLSTQSYWAKGRSLSLIRKSIENSLCFGVFKANGKQIGFARIATDYVVFAWLMDVFVDKDYRGLGIGKWLMHYIVNHPDLENVNGIGLRTNDAHKLYEKFGFKPIPNPETWLLRKYN